MIFPSIGVEYLEVKESNKMYLFLFTLIYCVITHIFNLSYEFSFGVYFIGLGLIKGLSSGKLKTSLISKDKGRVQRKQIYRFFDGIVFFDNSVY